MFESSIEQATGRAGRATHEFILQKEKQEAERKRIELKASRLPEDRATGISTQLLRMEGIEATEKLARARTPRS